MEYRSRRTGIVYRASNPELIALFDAAPDLEKIEGPKVEKPEAPKTTTRKKKKNDDV